MRGRWEFNINVWFWLMYSQKLLDIFISKHNYNVLSPNFHILVSVSDLYIPRIGLPICLGIYKSFTDTVHECRNWEQGCAVPFLGINKLFFRYSAGYSFVYSKLQDIAWLCAALGINNYCMKKSINCATAMKLQAFWLGFRLKLLNLTRKNHIFLDALIFQVEFIMYQYFWTELYIQQDSVCQLAAVTEEVCMVILYGFHLNTTTKEVIFFLIFENFIQHCFIWRPLRFHCVTGCQDWTQGSQTTWLDQISLQIPSGSIL
jgi:hypothetical protein